MVHLFIPSIETPIVSTMARRSRARGDTCCGAVKTHTLCGTLSVSELDSIMACASTVKKNYYLGMHDIALAEQSMGGTPLSS